METVDSAVVAADDPRMEARVKKLEDDLSALRTDVAIMRSNYVTKEDLHKELHATTWKIIGTFAVLCGTVFWIARNVAPPPYALPAQGSVFVPGAPAVGSAGQSAANGQQKR
jgi:hypothetical protein